MKQKIIFASTIIVIIALAYILGAEAGGLLSSIGDEFSTSSETVKRQIILDRTGNLEIGTKIPNYFFHDLDGNFVELEKIIKSKTLLTYVTSECDACIIQVETFKKFLESNKTDYDIVLISFSSPYNLMEMMKSYDLSFRTLYDHGNQYGRNLEISTFPFNIVLDSGLIVTGIYPGKLTEKQLKEVIN